eukprot:scaffold27078_cov77-Skeletonema_dohrnii-CCMP3373.AAC.5
MRQRRRDISGKMKLVSVSGAAEQRSNGEIADEVHWDWVESLQNINPGGRDTSKEARHLARWERMQLIS